MQYSINDLKAEVRVALDLNINSTPLSTLEDLDTLTNDEIIEAMLPRAARMVIEAAPHHLLDRGEPFAEVVKWNTAIGQGMGWIQLPDDFLRLVTFQMSDWAYPVVQPILEDDPLYIQQKSKYGIKGNTERPVVAIVHQPIGLVLEFYSCNSAENDIQVKRARYIPIPRVVEGIISFPEKLKEAVVMQTCYLVSQTLADDGAAARYEKITQNMLQ